MKIIMILPVVLVLCVAKDDTDIVKELQNNLGHLKENTSHFSIVNRTVCIPRSKLNTCKCESSFAKNLEVFLNGLNSTDSRYSTIIDDIRKNLKALKWEEHAPAGLESCRNTRIVRKNCTRVVEDFILYTRLWIEKSCNKNTSSVHGTEV